MENRAAVFSNQPQNVEVFQDGVWSPGSLLGWRHDVHGSCQVWVRLDTAGSEVTIWTKLDRLRLPGSGSERSLTAVSAEVRAGSQLSSDADPATRELRRIDDGARAGRRRRPPVGPASVVGDSSPESVPDWRSAAARAGEAAGPGRHRAPAASGRHRAADTETFPAVKDVESTVRQRLTWPVAVQDGWPVAVEPSRPSAAARRSAPRVEAEPDPFTRPLRLNAVATAAAPRPRTAWDDRLGGV